MSRPAKETRSLLPFPFIWLGALLVLLGATTTAPARACEITPAEDGRIGAWLLGPSVFATGLESLLLAVRGREQIDLQRGLWKGQVPIQDASGTLEPRRILTKVGYPGNRAVFGGVLSVDTATLDALLLLRVDGAAVVSVGGASIWSQRDDWRAGNAWQVVPLNLPVGDHRLEIAVQSSIDKPSMAVRLLDRATFQRPDSAHWLLPGVSERSCVALRAELLQTSVAWVAVDGQLVPEVRLAAPGGYPSGATEIVRVAVTRGTSAVVVPDHEVARFTVPNRETSRDVVRLPPIQHDKTWPASLKLRVSVTVGSRVAERFLGSSFDARTALQDAYDAVTRMPGGLDALQKPERIELRDTLVVTLARLTRALDVLDWSTARLETKRLRLLSSALSRGSQPWQSPGIHEVAIRTTVADTPERVLVHVPVSYLDRAQAPLPLVVVLHGFGGSPEGILGAFLDQDLHQARPSVDGFVLAPDAFGNTFYRGAGEQAVLDAIDWALQSYSIDRNRVSITGVSMGGTGTTHIGLRYAERFAAIASLCGYESYFVRRDTAPGPRTAWERASMHRWSPASWAENGNGLGLFVARGTEDKPLDHSRVLVEGFIRAGLGVRTEWPDAGHRIWPIVYHDARLWSWLTAFRREPSPARVVLHTDALRYGKRAWVRLNRLDRALERASVVAERRANGDLVAQTDGVLGLTLSPDASVASVAIDGQTVPLPDSRPISLSRIGKTWELDQNRRSAQRGDGALNKRLKRAGLEGPIHDAYLDRLVFVYGTLDPATRLANREIAEAWARGGPGVRLDYPVIADTEVTIAMHQQASLFLVGSERDHCLLRRWSSRLPIASSDGRLRVAREHYDYPEGGALFIHPNPEGAHYIVVLTAPTLGGLWRSFSLPKLLPDYIVWDERLRAATGKQLLGHVPVIAAGRFEEDWSLADSDLPP